MWIRWMVVFGLSLLAACGDDSGAGDGGTGGSAGAAGTGGDGGPAGSGGTGASGGTGGTGGVPDPGGDRTAGDAQLEFALSDGVTLCQKVPCPEPFTYIEISPMGGAPLAIAFPACGTVVCDTCQESVCPNSCDDADDGGFSLEPAEPQSLNWDGGHWAGGTCGGGTPCVRHTFAAPGKYRAQLCALQSSSASCTDAGDQVCTEVDFDYPSEQTFSATLGE